MNQKYNRAALLINMGGPENLAEVGPFMRRLFSDPCIMNIPGLVRPLAARLIVAARLSAVKEHYQQIGGGSPLKKWTARQAELVAEQLQKKQSDLTVKAAYSYSAPMIISALAELFRSGIKDIIAVPLYPHYSEATLGSVYGDLEKGRKDFGWGDRLRIISPFFDDARYVNLTAYYLKEALSKVDLAKPYSVVFSAHALPQSFIDRGDPYRRQVEKTLELILKEVPLNDCHLAFQSKIGPVKWMEPSTVATVKEIGGRGIRQVIVVPIGFVCDHIETLYELDIELAEIARAAGIEVFIRGRVPNDDPQFASMLVSKIEDLLP